MCNFTGKKLFSFFTKYFGHPGWPENFSLSTDCLQIRRRKFFSRSKILTCLWSYRSRVVPPSTRADHTSQNLHSINGDVPCSIDGFLSHGFAVDHHFSRSFADGHMKLSETEKTCVEHWRIYHFFKCFFSLNKVQRVVQWMLFCVEHVEQMFFTKIDFIKIIQFNTAFHVFIQNDKLKLYMWSPLEVMSLVLLAPICTSWATETQINLILSASYLILFRSQNYMQLFSSGNVRRLWWMLWNRLHPLKQGKPNQPRSVHHPMSLVIYAACIVSSKDHHTALQSEERAVTFSPK